MQVKAKLAQTLDLFDHVQYMISDRCPLLYSGVKDGTTSLISLNIVGSAEGLVQYLKHVLQLSILKLTTELVIHRSPHNAMHRDVIIDLLLISISYHTVCV